MELEKSRWLENFDETCQDIMEDTILLDSLAMYAAADSFFLNRGAAPYLLPTLRRLTDYLTQHVLELHRLEKKLTL